ncbi:MAG: hypothetical protein KDA89_19215, partial [Planctomycetaceae bacterium]|nr:hypothetical protein [Planctomycetaceae bacterium]
FGFRHSDGILPHEPSSTGNAGDQSLLLWLGLSVLIGGQTFQADGRAVISLTNAIMGGAAGVVAWAACNRVILRIPIERNIWLGSLCGTGAMAAAAGLVLPQSAMVIGGVSAILCNLVSEKFIGEKPVHRGKLVAATLGISSAVGLVLTGVFATNSVAGNRWDGREVGGLIQGNGSQVVIQMVAVAVTVLWSLLMSRVILFVFQPSNFVPVDRSPVNTEQ